MNITQLFTLVGLIFNTAGSIYIIKVTYNLSELEKINPIKWGSKPNQDGILNFKMKWSVLGKKVAIGIGIIVFGFLLQIIGLFA